MNFKFKKDKPEEDRRRIKANDPVFNSKFVYAVSFACYFYCGKTIPAFKHQVLFGILMLN